MLLKWAAALFSLTAAHDVANADGDAPLEIAKALVGSKALQEQIAKFASSDAVSGSITSAATTVPVGPSRGGSSSSSSGETLLPMSIEAGNLEPIQDRPDGATNRVQQIAQKFDFKGRLGTVDGHASNTASEHMFGHTRPHWST